MSKTILVTGGAGYIGSFMVKELLDNDYKVIVLDSLENGHKEAVDNRATLEIADLKDHDAINQIFKKYFKDKKQSSFRGSPHGGIYAVFDFAAYLAVGESMEEPKKYMDNNVVNFVRLLDAMSEHGCNYIIKSSTASSYGNPEDKYFPLKENYQDEYEPKESALSDGRWPSSVRVGERKSVRGEEFFQKIIGYYNELFINRPELTFNEDDLKKLRIPASVYGLTKVMDEIIMKKYEAFTNIKHIALRYFNVSGAAFDGSIGEDKPKPTTIMTVCFWNILGRMPYLTIFGTDYLTKDGTGIRDYIHPLDLATGHIAALKYLENEHKSGIFNLGRGEGYSVFDVVAEVEKASGKRVKYKIGPRRSGDPAVSYADPAKAEKILDWRAKYTLTDMAETAWKWHSSHPKGYLKGK